MYLDFALKKKKILNLAKNGIFKTYFLLLKYHFSI